MCLRRIGALVLLLASAAHGASRVVFNPADASEGPVCILGKGYDNLTASCDIAVSSGASVQGNADRITAEGGRIGALEQAITMQAVENAALRQLIGNLSAVVANLSATHAESIQALTAAYTQADDQLQQSITSVQNQIPQWTTVMKWGTQPVCGIAAQDGTTYDPNSLGYGGGDWTQGDVKMTNFLSGAVPSKVRLYFPQEGVYAYSSEGFDVAPDATFETICGGSPSEGCGGAHGNCVRSMRIKLAGMWDWGSTGYLIFSEHEGNNDHGGICVHGAQFINPNWDCDGNSDQWKGFGLFMRHAGDEMNCASGSSGVGGMWKASQGSPNSAKCYGNTVHEVEVQFHWDS